MIAPSPISSIGTVQNRASHLTVQWFCDTGSFSNRSSMQPQPSISAWLLSDVSRLKLPIPGLLSPELAAGIRRVKGVRRIGVRVGNWLTAEQAKRLLAVADRGSLRGKRDYAMIAMLVGCGLRRGELLALRVDSIQSREEHWVIADLLGKAGHIRTVRIPSWVKVAIDEWKEAGCITEGALFRSINKTGRVWEQA
jgi:integrase